MQGPSPSAQGLEEEHLEISWQSEVITKSPNTNTDTNANTNTDQSLALAAVILRVPESPGGSAVVVPTDEVALAVRVLVAVPLPGSALPDAERRFLSLVGIQV